MPSSSISTRRGGLIGRESVGLTAGSIQGQHQERTQTFAQRVRLHHLFELRHELSCLAALEARFEEHLDGGEPLLVEPYRGGFEQRRIANVGESTTAPARERGLHLISRVHPTLVGRGPDPVRHCTFECLAVELVDVQHVAGAARRQVLGPKRLAESRDVLLQGVLGPIWSGITPDGVDQRRNRHDVIRLQCERGEQRALAGPFDGDRFAVDGHLQRAEHPRLESRHDRKRIAKDALQPQHSPGLRQV